MIKNFFRDLLLQLNSRIASALPGEILQQGMSDNWKNRWTAWEPHRILPTWHGAIERFLDRHFKPTLRRDGSLLDLGCDHAWYSLSVAPLCRHVYGFDISSAFLKAAQERAANEHIDNVTFIQADLVPWADSPFGLPEIENRLSGNLEDADWEISHILLIALLTYFADDAQAIKMLRVCRTLLPENGVMAVMDSVTPPGKKRYIYTSHNGYKAIHRPVGEYEHFITEAGFEICEKEFIVTKRENCHMIYLLKRSGTAAQ